MPIKELSQDKIQKQFHYIHFIAKALIIAFALFWAIQLCCILLFTNVSSEEYGAKFVGHNYCGTFFMEISEKDFQSHEAFEAYKAYNKDTPAIIASAVMGMGGFVLALLVLRKADKGRLYSKGSGTLMLSSSFLLFLSSILTEIFTVIKQNEVHQYYKGVMATSTYYFQMHVALAIPFFLFCAALLLWRNEVAEDNTLKRLNSKLLRGTAVIFLLIGGGFILLRFGTRVYELVILFINNGKDMAVRIPFYSELIDLPSSAAFAAEDYIKLVVFRFIKDLPVFIASALCVVLLARKLFWYAKDRITVNENRGLNRIMIISLTVSSVLFNVLGIIEVQMLNSDFTGNYRGVFYTIGIRANCEPLVYVLFIYMLGLFEQSYKKTAGKSKIMLKKAREKAESTQ